MTTYFARTTRGWAATRSPPTSLIEVDGRADRRGAPGVERARATRLRGVTLPGLANAHSHAFQRALRGRTQRGGGSFWTWREDMYALAATMTPDRCFELARGTYAEMLQRRDHVRRRVRLPALQRRADRGRGRDRHPAHAAGRVLPRGRVRRAAERRAAALQRRRRGALGRARVARSRARRSAPRSTPSARCPRDQIADRRRVGAGQAAALPRLRAARRERGLPRRARLHARRSCWPSTARSARTRTAVHATHLTDADERAAARDHDLHVPDDRARPRRRHRPTPARSSALGSDSHAVIDLFEEARAVELNLRLATERRGHFTARRAAATARPTTRASAGPTPAGSSPGALADLVTVGLDSPRLETAEPDTHARVDRVRRHRGRRHQRRRRRQAVLIDNIGTLVTNDPELGTLADAALVFERRHRRLGRAAQRRARGRRDERFDAGGPRGHPRLRRLPRPPRVRRRPRGGVRRADGGPPVHRRRHQDDGRRPPAPRATTQLGANLDRLVAEALRSGTTTVETKSGYGLTVPDERRSLQVATPRTDETHVPRRPRRPARARRRRLRRPRQGRDARRLRAARALDRRLLRGRRVRRRADPRDPRGRHREGPDAARARQPARPRPGRPDRGRARTPPPPTTAPTSPTTTSTRWPTRDTVATLLPGAEFSTRAPYPDARRLIDAGVTVALAADCNPGSSYTTNIPFCIAIAVREMRMTPDEAVWAATAGRRDRRSAAPTSATSRPGARADAVLLDAPSHIHLAYRPGVPLVAAVWRDGA